jgi:8-oxo-dGTP diphosphatase
MNAELERLYGNTLRVRVCGLCYRDNELLLIKHVGLGDGFLWSMPGGGLTFGENAENRLKTEFLEETGLRIQIKEFLFACEFISGSLHAIELYFEVLTENDEPITGTDPEMPLNHQLITEVKFMNQGDIGLIPTKNLHGIFKICPEIVSLRQLRGYYTIK